MFTLRHNFVRRHPIGATATVAIFLCGVLLWQFRSPILATGADLWAVSDRINAPADAVIVLGGQYGFRPRTRAAADLYRRGLAAKVLVSNPDQSTPPGPKRERTDAEINKRLLLKLGVPASAIFIFGNGLEDTYAEAHAVSIWAKETHAKSVILPVEWYFSRRASWIFQHELAQTGVKVQMQSLDSIEPSPADWWRRAGGFALLRTEFLKYVYYRLMY